MTKKSLVADRLDIASHLPIIKKFASQSKVVVEIGPDMGNGSTRAIQHGTDAGNTRIWITVDIHDHIIPECRPKFSGWSMVIGDSREQSTVDMVSSILGGELADLIFIDTVHEKEFLSRELAVWKQIASPSTVWLFHDTWMFGNYNRMTDAIKEFAAKYPQWKYIDISQEDNGLGALIPFYAELSNYVY